MDVMEKTSKKHKFKVLFHEKPFAGINGSGKHNNWSMATNTGKNLLSPGKTPKTNLQFLTFFINTIKAFNDHADLLRASIASAGNEHRLGANEAPPAIMSIFIGTQLTNVLNDLDKKVSKDKLTPDEKTDLKLNIGKIPQIILDNTDRNRTSPFAFTGNKFEFRAVGSSENCAAAMIVLNTIVANQLKEFKLDVEKLVEKGTDKDEAIFKLLRKYYLHSKNVLFEGNGYGEEWVQEALKRGLSNIKDTPNALKGYISEKSIKLFIDNSIFNEREVLARFHIKQEKYFKKIQIESRVIGDLALNHIIPTALKFQNLLIQNANGLKNILDNRDFEKYANFQISMIKEISDIVAIIKNKVNDMINERKIANEIEDVYEKSVAYSEKVKPYFEDIRNQADKLELIIDDELWTLPKYRELLFIK